MCSLQIARLNVYKEGVFRGRRRPITFNGGSTSKEEYGNLLEVVMLGF